MKIFRIFIICSILLQPVIVLSEEEMHTLNLQDTDIRLLVETISDITGKNFVIDPEVEAKITVISGHPVAKDKIYDLFLSILSVNGFTTESQGSTIKIIPIAKSNPLSGLNGSHPDQLMTKIFRIKHVPVTDVEHMLKTMAGNKVKIISNKDSNVLIVSDKAANIKKIDALIKNIDQKSDTSIELIALQHASAQDVAETLSQLLESTNTLGPQSKIVPDHRTNSVIINANPAIKARIMSIIAKLDVPLETNTQAQVIYLKYASAETLVPILETLANKNQKEDEQLQTSIQAHKETNSLVINATPAVYNNILNAIEKLDIKRRQVLIEAIIADVIIDNSREIGVDWFAPLAGDGSSGIVGGSFTGNSLPNLDDSGTGPLDIFGGLVSGGLNLGYLNFGTNSNGDSVLNFGGLLKAISQNGKNNILSTPSLVTLNHQEAKLSVGQEVPFVTGQFSNTGVGNSAGSPNPFTTIQRQDVGLSLTVTPHINEGDQIVVEISQEISSLDPSAGAVDLITNKRTLSTTVMIPDNTVLVLGGLIDDSVQETIRKVPLLGDIPLLKNLFRTKKRVRAKRNLMVFIHPRIIRDAHHQQQITNEKYDEIRRQQQEKVQPNTFRRGEPILPEIEQQ